MYHSELEIKNTTITAKSASYLDLHLSVDTIGRLYIKLDDKRDHFSFQIMNFPFLSSYIPTSLAYGVYILQLIHYSRACAPYSDFLERAKTLSLKLLNQGYIQPRLKKNLKNVTVIITSYSIDIRCVTNHRGHISQCASSSLIDFDLIPTFTFR